MADLPVRPSKIVNKRTLHLDHCPTCGGAFWRQRCVFGRNCQRCAKIKHGLSHHPIYCHWQGMMDRCFGARQRGWMRYGGRGITVCAEWRSSPTAFVAWADANGWRPGLELDRIDNDGDYEPGNCRWATREEQQRNKSNSVLDAEMASRIKRLLLDGFTPVAIECATGVKRHNVQAIKRGLAWRDVQPAEPL